MRVRQMQLNDILLSLDSKRSWRLEVSTADEGTQRYLEAGKVPATDPVQHCDRILCARSGDGFLVIDDCLMVVDVYDRTQL